MRILDRNLTNVSVTSFSSYINLNLYLPDQGFILLFRYTPAYTPLAIQELDEKHLGAFSFRTREGFLQVHI